MAEKNVYRECSESANDERTITIHSGKISNKRNPAGGGGQIQ